MRGPQGLISAYGAVDNDYRDLGVLRLRQHRVPTILNHRRQANDVDSLLYTRTGCRDLVLLFLLRVGEDELLDAHLLGSFLHRRRVGRAPVTFRSELRITERHVAIGFGAALGCRSGRRWSLSLHLHRGRGLGRSWRG